MYELREDAYDKLDDVQDGVSDVQDEALLQAEFLGEQYEIFKSTKNRPLLNLIVARSDIPAKRSTLLSVEDPAPGFLYVCEAF